MLRSKKLPLFIITGASGTGKTTVVPDLRESLPNFDVFDTDEIFSDVGDWQKLKNIWVKIASNIAAGNRMTVLCGTMMPWDVEKCDNYNDFCTVFYMNLHCQDEVREKRLRERGWNNELIQEHKNFAKWLLENADKAYSPPMDVINTSDSSPKEVAFQITEWIKNITDVELNKKDQSPCIIQP